MAGVSILVSFLRQGEGQPPTSYLVAPLPPPQLPEKGERRMPRAHIKKKKKPNYGYPLFFFFGGGDVLGPPPCRYSC